MKIYKVSYENSHRDKENIYLPTKQEAEVYIEILKERQVTGDVGEILGMYPMEFELSRGGVTAFLNGYFTA